MSDNERLVHQRSVRFSREMISLLDQRAARTGMTVSQIVRVALEKLLADESPQPAGTQLVVDGRGGQRWIQTQIPECMR